MMLLAASTRPQALASITVVSWSDNSVAILLETALVKIVGEGSVVEVGGLDVVNCGEDTVATPDYPITSTDLSNITMNNNASPKIVATVFSPQLTTSKPPTSTTDPSPTTLTKAVSGKMATEPTDQLTTVIDVKACGLMLAANSIIFLTIFAFFVAFNSDDIEYSSSYSSW